MFSDSLTLSLLVVFLFAVQCALTPQKVSPVRLTRAASRARYVKARKARLARNKAAAAEKKAKEVGIEDVGSKDVGTNSVVRKEAVPLTHRQQIARRIKAAQDREGLFAQPDRVSAAFGLKHVGIQDKAKDLAIKDKAKDVATKGIIRNKDVIRPKKTVRFAPLPPKHITALARAEMRVRADLEHIMRIPRPSRYNFAFDQPRPKIKKTVRFAEEPMAATSNYATKISMKRLLIRSAPSLLAATTSFSATSSSATSSTNPRHCVPFDPTLQAARSISALLTALPANPFSLALLFFSGALTSHIRQHRHDSLLFALAHLALGARLRVSSEVRESLAVTGLGYLVGFDHIVDARRRRNVEEKALGSPFRASAPVKEGVW
ncbi:unnamed protein product [Tilletia controversa]|nr:unnamed protein product [Tilletia controversa]